MLEEVEKYNHQHIVSWEADGMSFRVYRPDEFVAKIMPHYFHQTQYRSFQRMVSNERYRVIWLCDVILVEILFSSPFTLVAAEPVRIFQSTVRAQPRVVQPPYVHSNQSVVVFANEDTEKDQEIGNTCYIFVLHER
jgi:hypothetical protein